MSHKQPLQRKSFLDKIADDVMNNFCFLCKSPEEILGKVAPPLPHGTSSKYSLYELEPQMKQLKTPKALEEEDQQFNYGTLLLRSGLLRHDSCLCLKGWEWANDLCTVEK